MKSGGPDERVRGLPSIAEARRIRLRGRWPAPSFYLWAAIALIAAFVFHHRRTLAALDEARASLLARQRGIEQELGARWYPVRDRVEVWVSQAGAPAAPMEDLAEADATAMLDKAGIYLRLRLEDAQSVEQIRAAASTSLRDGFVACFVRGGAAPHKQGPACQKNRDCPTGQVCGVEDQCGPPSQPFNLRLGYKSFFMLDPTWVRRVEQADDRLVTNLLAEELQSATVDDLPLAIDMLARARYALLVLDEPASADGSPARAASKETMENRQLSAHPARVLMYGLDDGKLLLRARRQAIGEAVGSGDPGGVTEALRRQVNSCGLALQVRSLLESPGPTAAP